MSPVDRQITINSTDSFSALRILGITQVYLEQKLVIEILLQHPPQSQKVIFLLLKIPILSEVKPKTTARKAVTLPLSHSDGYITLKLVQSLIVLG